MGLDSVEIVITWEETFGIPISDSEVVDIRTPRQAMDLISKKLGASDAKSFCPTLRAFHVFRAAVRQVTGDSTRRLRLSESLRDLPAGRWKKVFWKECAAAMGLEGFRPPAVLFRRATVRDAVEDLVARHLHRLRKPSEPWTRTLVRFGVRSGVTCIMGTRNFDDDDDFIKDIGID